MSVNIVFWKYYPDSKKFDNLSFQSNNSFLQEFLNDLSKFKKLKTIKQKAEKNNTNVCDTALELYNELLETYYDEYCSLSDAKRKKMDRKYKPKTLFIEGYD